MGLEVKREYSIHNRFDVEVRDAKTGELKQQAYAENIILNALWSRMLSYSNNYFGYIHIGTGTGTLAASRTALFTFLVAKTASASNAAHDMANGVAWRRKYCQLIETEQNGQTLTELGIGYDGTSSHLMTHALLKDMNGNQVSILKADTDIITIYATVYAHYNPAGWESGGIKLFTHLFNNNANRAPLFDSLLWWVLGCYDGYGMADFDFEFTEGFAPCINGGSSAGSTYNAGNFYEDRNPTLTYDIPNKKATLYARIPAASANYANDVKGFHLMARHNENFARGICLYVDLTNSDVYAGSTIVGESLGTGDGTKTGFRTDFSLVNAGAKVYVDGVEDTDVMITSKPAGTDLTSFIKCLGILTTTAYLSPEDTPMIGCGQVSNATNEAVTIIFENPLYATFGIESVYTSRGTLYCSDDLNTWTSVGTNSGSPAAMSIGASYKNKRYWKFVCTSGYTMGLWSFVCANATPNNVIFDTPPANGGVVTMDYVTPGIGKDANHVFDFTLTLQLGEYTT